MKTKVSISLDTDVLEAVDRRAAREKTTRSAIMEQWLRGAARQAELQRLEEETAAYYDSLTPAEKAEDAALARASSRAFRELTIDDPPRKPQRRSRRG
jgi:metal-responsive CopG/Arc/MetJ family transcriptional regulator